MKLIVDKSIQNKQMEIEMERMVQEKWNAAQIASTIVEALPLIALPMTTPAGAAIGARSSAKELARSIEGMNMQNEEMKRVES